MNKKGISTVVASVLVILITVASVSLVWFAVMPMVGDIDLNVNPDLELISNKGYTLWDNESRLATVQVGRGSDESNIVGFDLVFSLEGTSVSHFIEDVPGINGEKVYYVNLSEYPGELDSVGIAPVFGDGSVGGIISELKIGKIGEADVVELIEEGEIVAEDFVLPSGNGGRSGGGGGGSSGDDEPAAITTCQGCGGGILNLCDKTECEVITEGCFYSGLFTCDSCSVISCNDYDQGECSLDICSLNCEWNESSCVEDKDNEDEENVSEGSGYVFFESPTPENNFAQLNRNIEVSYSVDIAGDAYSFVNFDNDLLLWMRFDDINASGYFVDASGHGNDGALVGNAAMDNDGRFGSGVRFDGMDSSVYVPSTGSLRTMDYDFSVAGWFRGTSDGYVLNTYDGHGGGFYQLSSQADGRLGAFIGRDARAYSIDSLNDNVWHHFVMVRDEANSEMRLYIDGVLNDNDPDMPDGEFLTYHSMNIWIGSSRGQSGFFEGSVDELMIFNRALLETEVEALYSAGSAYRNFVDLPAGNYSVRAVAVNESGVGSVSRVIIILPDNAYPIFSDYLDDSGTLDDIGVGSFSVEVLSTNGTVVLEINGENIAAINSGGNRYSASYSFPFGGYNYSYRWHSWGSGEDDNYNSSESRIYRINPVTDIFPPRLSKVSPSLRIQETNYVDISVASNEDLNYCMLSFDNFLSSIPMNLDLGLRAASYVDNSMSDGYYVASIWCNDTNGNVNSSESIEFVVDTVFNGDFDIEINASRTSGVAPLSVFFDTTSTQEVFDGSYIYTTTAWDFDATDVDAGANYRTGSGFVAAHVYENPGTYRVRVDIYTEDGRHAWDFVDIDVEEFSGTTYYVATDGSDSNNGLSPNFPFQTVEYALTGPHFVTNTQILFKNGDTFMIDNQPTVYDAVGPIIVGAYSDPSDTSSERPLIFTTAVDGPWAIIYFYNCEDIRIMDIAARALGESSANPRYPQGIGWGNSRYMLKYRTDEYLNGGMSMSPCGQYNTVAESLFHNTTNTGYCSGGYSNTDNAIIGNKVYDKNTVDPHNWEHIFRLQSGHRWYIAHNEFGPNVNVHYDTLTIRGNSSKVVIYDNIIYGWITAIWPQNRNSAREYQDHCIIDSNLFIGTGQASTAIALHSKDIVIRNNIIYNYTWGISIGDDTVVGPSDRVKVYHNTMINPTYRDYFFFSSICNNCEDVEIYNNLMFDESGSRSTYTNFLYMNEDISSDNNIVYSLVNDWTSWEIFGDQTLTERRSLYGQDVNSYFIDPELVSTNLASGNFGMPLQGSPLVDNGRYNSGNRLDFNGNMRDSNHDIGAIEFL